MKAGRGLLINLHGKYLLRASVASQVFYFLLVSGTLCKGAEQPAWPGWEKYLQRLGYIAVPMEFTEDNKLMVRLEMEGKRRTFCVDTGCSMTAVDSLPGRKLKTLGELGVDLEDSCLGHLTNRECVLMSLKLGGAIFTNQPAERMKLDVSGQILADGVLGCDFFYRNFCLIECQQGRLYVRGAEPPVQMQEVLEANLRAGGYRLIQMSRSSSLLMTLDAKANGERVQCVLDTGATWSSLDKFTCSQLRLDEFLMPYNRVGGIGKIGETRLAGARLKSLEVGDVVFKNLDIAVEDLRIWGLGVEKRPLSNVHGIVGVDTLARNGAIIDCAQHKLWLKPRQP